MKRISLVATFAVSLFSLTAENVTINHTTAGGLEAELNAAIAVSESLTSMADITGLTITGEAAMNSADFVAIRTHLRPSLTVLDMSQAVFTNNAIPGSLYDSGGALNNMHSLVTVVLPETLTTICGGCFANCENLENVNLPEGLQQIWHYTFRNCSKINFEKFPEGIKVFNPYCFEKCTSLTVSELPSNTKQILGYAFNETEVSFSELPATVEKLGEQCFRKTKVSFSEFPAGITELPASCFSGTKVAFSTIPSNITSIGQCLLQSVKTLPEFTIPNVANLWTKIPKGMFFTNSNDVRSFVCRAPQAPAVDKVTGDNWDESFGRPAQCTNTTMKVLASAMESFQTTAPYSSMKLVALTTPVAMPTIEMPEGYDESDITLIFTVNNIDHTDLSEEVLEGDGELVIQFSEDAEIRLFVDEVRYSNAADYAALSEEDSEETEEPVDADLLYKISDPDNATKQEVRVPVTVAPDMRPISVKIGYNAAISGVDSPIASETGITRRGDIFYLTSNGAKLYDMQSRIVASTTANTLDLSFLPSGVYILQAGKTIQKILK